MNFNFLSVGKLFAKLSSGAIFMLLLNPVGFQAQTSVTVPDSSSSTGNFTLFNTTMRNLQLIIDDSLLTGLTGKYIKSIAFRLPNTTTVAWPSSAVTVSSFSIYMGTGVEPANRQLNFDANYVGAKTLVRSGVLNIPVGSFPLYTASNPYSFELVFDTPWHYVGDNLVIEIRHPGITGSSSAMAGVSTSTAGYGTLYTACWSSTATAAPAQASFNSVKINAVDNLDVSSVELIEDDLKIYPNPVKDILTVDFKDGLKEIRIINNLGQTVLNKMLNGVKQDIDVSKLSRGIYYIQVENKNKEILSSKFIKE